MFSLLFSHISYFPAFPISSFTSLWQCAPPLRRAHTRLSHERTLQGQIGLDVGFGGQMYLILLFVQPDKNDKTHKASAELVEFC